MARTPSTMLELGTQAPDFSLPEPATGRRVGLADFAGQPLAVIFLCNHCPYVKHIAARLGELGKEYADREVALVCINANDVDNYPDDAPDKMPDFLATYGIDFPYLYDETQEVAKAYRAACTPDIFLFNADHTLVYRGQFDDARPGNDAPVTGRDLRNAMNTLLSGAALDMEQIPSLGCNIKWRAGNEPDYFAA